jgi:hypothetical protein
MVNQKHVYAALVFDICCLGNHSFEFLRVKEKWEIFDSKGNEQAWYNQCIIFSQQVIRSNG